jgi:hypothetical protein
MLQILILTHIPSLHNLMLRVFTTFATFATPVTPAAAKTLTQSRGQPGHVAPRFWVLNYATQAGHYHIVIRINLA